MKSSAADNRPWHKKLYEPFGFDQGDPLVICQNEDHMRYVQEAFKLKAYYCCWGASICARRFSHAIAFRLYAVSHRDEDRYRDWIRNSVETHLEVGSRGIILV